MTENPTLVGVLIVAITALAGVVVYLYKQTEKQKGELSGTRDKHEERLLTHTKDIQVLLEKTLIAFGEVEKKVFETSDTAKDKITKAVLEGQKNILDELKEILKKLNQKNNGS